MIDRANLAVVVGGGAGIGAGVVEAYRERGLPVVVWDIDGERDIDCDVTDPAQVDGALAETLDRFGPPTTATITAGVGHAGELIDLAPDAFDRVLGVNTKGVWLAMRALARPMIDAGAGSIVATSSISARVADRGMGLYCASKAALDMLVRVAALEWAPHHVRVNAVAPGRGCSAERPRTEAGSPACNSAPRWADSALPPTSPPWCSPCTTSSG